MIVFVGSAKETTDKIEDPMPGNNSLAVFDNVSRTYDKGRISALKDISFSVEPGEFVAITGPSGSGKSTILHLLCGIDRPTRGRVFFNGKEPMSTSQWAKLRSKRMGFVFQAFNLFPTMTALENVEIPMFGVISKRKNRRRHAMELLTNVGLSHRIEHRPSMLSGGERQRVAVARSLANSPDLLLADEPTGNLDTQASTEIIHLLSEIQKNHGVTLIIVSHDPDIARRAERTIHITDGRILKPKPV